MMVLALLIAAAVVSATLRSEPKRLVAAEVARRSPGEAPRSSSGEEGSATKKSSSEKETPGYPSEEESLGYGSSSSAESVGQRKEEAKEPQAMLQRKAQTPSSQSAMPQPAEQQTPSEVPSRPEPQSQEQPLPNAQGGGWSEPTRGELERANRARHYELHPGAIMGLTIEALGIHEAPVFDSDSQWALANGVAHHPQTSLPWSQSAQRNVYLAGHRMGHRGTWSRMIFYNLHKLKRGDKVLLKEWINGKKYYYVHVYYWWETPDQMTHIRDDWYYCKYHKYVAADSPKPYFEAWVTYKPTGNHYWEEFFYTEELV